MIELQVRLHVAFDGVSVRSFFFLYHRLNKGEERNTEVEQGRAFMSGQR